VIVAAVGCTAAVALADETVCDRRREATHNETVSALPLQAFWQGGALENAQRIPFFASSAEEDGENRPFFKLRVESCLWSDLFGADKKSLGATYRTQRVYSPRRSLLTSLATRAWGICWTRPYESVRAAASGAVLVRSFYGLLALLRTTLFCAVERRFALRIWEMLSGPRHVANAHFLVCWFVLEQTRLLCQGIARATAGLALSLFSMLLPDLCGLIYFSDVIESLITFLVIPLVSLWSAKVIVVAVVAHCSAAGVLLGWLCEWTRAWRGNIHTLLHFSMYSFRHGGEAYWHGCPSAWTLDAGDTWNFVQGVPRELFLVTGVLASWIGVIQLSFIRCRLAVMLRPLVHSADSLSSRWIRSLHDDTAMNIVGAADLVKMAGLGARACARLNTRTSNKRTRSWTFFFLVVAILPSTADAMPKRSHAVSSANVMDAAMVCATCGDVFDGIKSMANHTRKLAMSHSRRTTSSGCPRGEEDCVLGCQECDWWCATDEILDTHYHECSWLPHRPFLYLAILRVPHTLRWRDLHSPLYFFTLNFSDLKYNARLEYARIMN
jgi:hypothetical protein